MKYTIVAAQSTDGIIAVDGKIPWWEDNALRKADLSRFVFMTTGGAVIMGRKTAEIIQKPLTGRLNIVLSRTRPSHVNRKDFSYFNGIGEMEMYLDSMCFDNVFVIGGGEVYRQFMEYPNTDKLEITTVCGDFNRGQYATFPFISVRQWNMTRNERKKGDKFEYFFQSYQRR